MRPAPHEKHIYTRVQCRRIAAHWHIYVTGILSEGDANRKRTWTTLTKCNPRAYVTGQLNNKCHPSRVAESFGDEINPALPFVSSCVNLFRPRRRGWCNMCNIEQGFEWKSMEMATVRQLHHRAMEWVDKAIIARRMGDTAEETSLYAKAYKLEAEAASMVEVATEPTRSILYRSAASMAIKAGKPQEAEELATVALAGDPPDEIARELRNILKQIN